MNRKKELYPQPFIDLTEMFRSLPGVGPRTAEKYALAFFSQPDARLEAFAEILAGIKKNTGICPECGAMSAGKDELCAVCADPERDRSVICVVEDFARMRSIENCGVFSGVYHILGGKLAPLEGKFADSLRIEPLIKKAEAGNIREIIFALGASIDSRATEVYIADMLKDKNIIVTCLAQGLPSGGDIANADPVTLSAALNGRNPFRS